MLKPDVAPHDRFLVRYYLPITKAGDFLAYLDSLVYLKHLAPLKATGYSETRVKGNYLADQLRNTWTPDRVRVISIAYPSLGLPDEELEKQLNIISDVLYTIYKLNGRPQFEIWTFVEKVRVCVWPDASSPSQGTVAESIKLLKRRKFGR